MKATTNRAKQNNRILANIVADELNNAPVMEQEQTSVVVVEAVTNTPPAQQEAAPEFPHCIDFPTLTAGGKFEINGYKVQITGKEYLKEEKWPFTAWSATVIAPDGTEKEFQKVRNTAIMNYCHASTGISHAGGSASVAKVLTDEELRKETERRCAQVAGLLQRATELYSKYTGGKLHVSFKSKQRNRIYSKLNEDNEARKKQKAEATARVKAKEQKKELHDLSATVAELIAAGKYAEVAELMKQKAQPTTAE